MLVVVRYALKSCLLLMIAWLAITYPAAAQVAPSDLPAVEAAADSPSPNSTDDSGQPAWSSTEATASPAPDIFLLPDAAGKLRQVLGFRYEEFLEFWQARQNTKQPLPPAYVIEEIHVSGQAEGDFARLRIVFDFELTAERWVQIPLLLPNLIVERLEIEKNQAGECVVFDEKRQSHVLWLSNGGGSERRLVVEGLARISAQEGVKGIELHLPRAITSQLTLRVSGENSNFESTSDLPVEVQQDDEGAVVAKLIGLGTPLRLSWKPVTREQGDVRSLFEVTGRTLVQLGRHQVRSHATLHVRSVNHPLRRVLIRLPQGAQLEEQESSADYELIPLGDGLQSLPLNKEQRLLEVRFKNPQQGEWDIRVASRRSFSSFGDSAECVVEGFETLDAFRQSGSVVLEIDNRLQGYFTLFGDIEQTAVESSTPTAPDYSVLAAFRYTRFPWQVVTVTSPRQRRNIVKPQHQLTINSEESQLDLQYAYQLSGAQTFSLRIDLRGWTLRDAPIESGGLVDQDRVVITREGQLILPLVNPDVQQVRVNLRLRQNSDLGLLELPLPEPLGCFVAEGNLRVSGADALSIVPQRQELIGLSVESQPNETVQESATSTANTEAGTTLYRTFLSRPTYVAEVAVRERQVLVSQRTRVSVDGQAVRVTQSLDYQCKYRPASQFTVAVPAELATNDSLQFLFEGEELSSVRSQTSQDDQPLAAASGKSNRALASEPWILRLPRPLIGSIAIQAAYTKSLPSGVDQANLRLQLPLIVPDDPLKEHVLSVNAPANLSVSEDIQTNPSLWSVVSTAAPSDTSSGALQLRSEEKIDRLRIRMDSRAVDQAQLATLEQGWIQVWMAGAVRQTRAVFRFRTSHPVVFCRLPAELAAAEIELLLDGQPQQCEFTEDGRLLVTLPKDMPIASHVLEVRYQDSVELPSLGTLRTDCPQLECHPTRTPIYWQLVLPRGWQVVGSPEELTPHYWLGWKNYRWGRQPTLTQTDLEQITGASSATEPAQLSTQYVYRSFSFPRTIEVVAIRRLWMFLAAAVVAFGIGLLWLYTPFFRHGYVWLGLVTVLFFGIFLYPEAALLVLQAVFAGGLMTVLGGILRRVFVAEAQKDPTPTNYRLEALTDVTGTWRPHSSLREGNTESTATLRTGGPVP